MNKSNNKLKKYKGRQCFLKGVSNIFTKKRIILLMLLLLICIVVVWWIRSSNKKEDTHENMTPIKALPWESPTKKIIKDHKYKGGRYSKRLYDAETAYDIDTTGTFRAKTIRKYSEDKNEETHYWYVRSLFEEDAKEVYEAVRDSGKDHFKKYMEGFFDAYGESFEKTTHTIRSKNGNNRADMGIFHSTDNKTFTFVGFIGIDETTYEKRNEHLKNAYNVHYAMCIPKVAKVQGVMPLILYGYVGSLFYYGHDNRYDTKGSMQKLILNIHKDNKQSQTVARRAGFDCLGQGNLPEIICSSEYQKIKDMQAYVLKRKEWQEKYFSNEVLPDKKETNL